MTFENRRFQRMQKVVELLQANPQGLSLRVIAKETKALMEIRKQTLMSYLTDLVWSGQVIYLRSKDKYKLKQ